MSQPLPPPQPPVSFQTKKEAIGWMLDACALRHKEAKTKKSDTTRVHFRCTSPDCDFCCHINKSSDRIFRVVKWKWHTCGEVSQPRVKPAWVVEKAKEKHHEVEELRPKDLQKVSRHNLVLM